LRALVMRLVLPCLQVRLRREELGLLLRLHLREVEVVPPAAEEPAGGIVRACCLLGTVAGPELDALAAGRELHRLGAIRALVDAAEPRRPDCVLLWLGGMGLMVELQATWPKRSGQTCDRSGREGRRVSTWRLGARVWIGIPRALPHAVYMQRGADFDTRKEIIALARFPMFRKAPFHTNRRFFLHRTKMARLLDIYALMFYVSIVFS
jgi:hypothetical protein